VSAPHKPFQARPRLRNLSERRKKAMVSSGLIMTWRLLGYREAYCHHRPTTSSPDYS
jgi:hypothetical protein